eukprot:6494372-Alexandrium_andersonii.AAC.1
MIIITFTLGGARNEPPGALGGPRPDMRVQRETWHRMDPLRALQTEPEAVLGLASFTTVLKR